MNYDDNNCFLLIRIGSLPLTARPLSRSIMYTEIGYRKYLQQSLQRTEADPGSASQEHHTAVPSVHNCCHTSYKDFSFSFFFPVRVIFKLLKQNKTTLNHRMVLSECHFLLYTHLYFVLSLLSSEVGSNQYHQLNSLEEHREEIVLLRAV